MDTLENCINIKVKEVCRTCLTDDGPFFNITDIFDHYTLTQMIQNITNLQIDSLDGYTQSICFECVKELRRTNRFRIKCLESNDSLIKLATKISEASINNCEIKQPKIEEVKQEIEECCNIGDYCLKTENDCKSESTDVESDYDNNEGLCKEDESSKNIRTENRSIIFDCPLCHGLFYRDDLFKNHITEFHPNLECFNQKRKPLGYKSKGVYKCVLDDFSGNTFDQFKNHMIKHTGKKPVVCVDCEFRTTEIYFLRKHRIQKHLEQKFSCPLCDYSCQENCKIKEHMAIHGDTETNYQCELCPMAFKVSSQLYKHKKISHEERIKKFVCSVCPKAFFYERSLVTHMNTHTGERPHVCHYCGMAFASPGYMQRHIKVKHDIKTIFKCDICDYSIHRKAWLRAHIQRHIGIKPFKCPQCPYRGLLKSNLKDHLLTHSGEKNFSCDLCDFKSSRAPAVKKHRKIHTGEKPFVCTECDYRTAKQYALKRHKEVHKSELLECPNCPYKVHGTRSLMRHMKNNCVIKKKGRQAKQRN